MRRRSPAPPTTVRRPLAATAVALLVVISGSGCSTGLDVAPAADAQDDACSAAAQRWPGTVGGQERRELDVAAAAAWGDPAIIARCGLTPPGPTTDPCIDVDGVYWVATELEDGYRLTTYGRSPAIEVLAPDDYAPQPMLLPAFNEAARQLPTTEHACYGPR